MNNQQPLPLHFQFQPLAAIGGQPAQLVYTCCMGCRGSNGVRPFYHCWRYNDEDDTDDEDDEDIEYDDDELMG
jgi:hypothetical protein